MLNHASLFKSEMELVLEMQGKSFHPFCDHEWRYNFAVCTDITQHNQLHPKLYVGTVFKEMFDKTILFGKKLRLSELQLQSVCKSRFSILRIEIQLLQQESNSWF
jgi:hypothetical protein